MLPQLISKILQSATTKGIVRGIKSKSASIFGKTVKTELKRNLSADKMRQSVFASLKGKFEQFLPSKLKGTLIAKATPSVFKMPVARAAKSLFTRNLDEDLVDDGLDELHKTNLSSMSNFSDDLISDNNLNTLAEIYYNELGVDASLTFEDVRASLDVAGYESRIEQILFPERFDSDGSKETQGIIDYLDNNPEEKQKVVELVIKQALYGGVDVLSELRDKKV